jgi:hypothetical protein
MLIAAPAAAQSSSSSIDSIIKGITPQSYRHHFDSLRTQKGTFRKVTATNKQSIDHDACRDYIFRALQKYVGSENVHLHTFDEGNYRGLANVIGMKRGQNPEKGLLIIGAHYDTSNSRDESKTNCSPGANDNGTGLAALLEIARVFSTLKTEYSVMFAAWDFEEQFTNWYPTGSNRWYTDHVEPDENSKRKNRKKKAMIPHGKIVANINFDMFGNPQDTIDGKPVLWACSGNSLHSRFVDDYVSTFDQYIQDIKVINNGKMSYSDHYTFAGRKIPSVENLESGYQHDPFYHTCSDNLENPDNVDFEFATHVTRGGLAFIIQKARLISPGNRELLNTPDMFAVNEQLNAYAISHRFNHIFIEVIDSYGRTVPVYSNGIQVHIYPPETGLYRIRVTDSTHSSWANYRLQKKEGQPVSFQ